MKKTRALRLLFFCLYNKKTLWLWRKFSASALPHMRDLFEVAHQIISYPQRSDADQAVNDAGDEIQIAGKYPVDEVEVGNTDNQPVESADNGQNQTDNR